MEKLKPITPEEWNEVNEFNRNILDEFIENSVELSPKSLGAYRSNLKIWFMWVKDNLKNKDECSIKPLEYKRYQNWLTNRGCSYSDIVNKRAAISSLNNYIEIYHGDEYPTFRNFINKSIKRPQKEYIHEKEPLTKAEFENLIDVLTLRGDWQKVAYLMFTFETGCRRAESRQLLRDIVNAQPIVREHDGKTVTFYQTPLIRCKGSSVIGKQRHLVFGEGAMAALKKWDEERGNDSCPYMFVCNVNGEMQQASLNAFNRWMIEVISPLVGRRVTPHSIRRSRATQAVVEEGKDIESVRALLGHESSDTTRIYVVRDETEDIDDLFI